MPSIPFARRCAAYTVSMDTTLIIAIGNVARGDDGVAHAVAELLADDDRLPASARIVTATGLDVAMAADVAAVARVVLVDAERRATPAVRTESLSPGPPSGPTGHAIDSPALLALAEALYGSAPPATLVSVAAPEMGHDEGLSATAETASREAASVVIALLAE